MVNIDRVTGTVTWDSYVLYPRLFHDIFAKKYPHLIPIHDESKQDEPRTRIYQFPTTTLDTSKVKVGITYYDSRLSGISIGIDYSEEIDLWRHELVEWVKVAQKWLLTQLSQPHEIQPAQLFDAEYEFTTEEIQLIQEWRYRFKWGNAGFSYDGLGQEGGIYIHYAYHQQIINWEEFADECELLLQKQQQQNGKYIAHLLTIRSLIDILRPHFDFQKVKPRIYYRGLGFALRNWEKITLDLNVYPDNIEKRYEIRRSGSVERTFIAANNQSLLVDKLRMLLETDEM